MKKQITAAKTQSIEKVKNVTVKKKLQYKYRYTEEDLGEGRLYAGLVSHSLKTVKHYLNHEPHNGFFTF